MIDLKRFRSETGIKQAEICRVIGVSQPYLSAIEKGIRPLNEEKFKKLYAQYGDIVLQYKLTERPIIVKTGEGEINLSEEVDEPKASKEVALGDENLLAIIESQQRTIERLTRIVETLTSSR